MRPLTEDEGKRAGEAALRLGKALMRYHVRDIYYSDKQTIGFLKEAQESGLLDIRRIDHIRESLRRHGV